MITSVRVYRNATDYLDLPMTSGQDVFLRRIEGLGAKNIVSMTDIRGIPGEAFRGIISDFRAITVEIGYSSMINSVQGRRNNVLKYIRPNKSVTFRFTSDDLETVEITGIVETFENEPFAKDPFVKATIICSDPYFRGLADVVSPLNITANGTYEFNYAGTHPVGFKAVGTLPTSGIFRMARNGDTGKYFELSHVGNFGWSTIPGSRYIVLNPATNPYSDFNTILEKINRLSTWHLLYPGVNSFVITSMLAGSSLNSFTWRNRYVGV